MNESLLLILRKRKHSCVCVYIYIYIYIRIYIHIIYIYIYIYIYSYCIRSSFENRMFQISNVHAPIALIGPKLPHYWPAGHERLTS